MTALCLVFAILAFCVFGVRYNEYHHQSMTSDGLVIDTILEANEPTICDPTVQQYSGYLRAGGTNNNYFYWFFESRNDSSTDPFIMWLTGLYIYIYILEISFFFFFMLYFCKYIYIYIICRWTRLFIAISITCGEWTMSCNFRWYKY